MSPFNDLFEGAKESYENELLDKFALTALPAVIKEASVHSPKSDIAKECYEIGREMMKERSKGL